LGIMVIITLLVTNRILTLVPSVRPEDEAFQALIVSFLILLACSVLFAAFNGGIIRLTKDLESKNNELKEADVVKSQFLANVSHELRNPLNTLVAFSEMLADGAMGELSEEVLEPIRDMELASKHLLGLVNDILDVSRIEESKGEIEVYPIKISLGLVLKETILLTTYKSKKRIVVKVSDPLPDAYVDRSKWKKYYKKYSCFIKSNT